MPERGRKAESPPPADEKAGDPAAGGASPAPPETPASCPPDPAGASKPVRLIRAVASYLRPYWTIRDAPDFGESVAAAAFCILLVLVLWSILTAGPAEERIIDSYTLPSPGETLASFHSLWYERALARSALWSLGRVVGGFLLAIIVAVPLGVAAGSFRRLYAFLRPLSIFGRNIPVAALIPLTLIWFGLGEAQKVMFIFLTSVAFVFFDSASAVDAVPDSYLDTAYTLGARFTPRAGLVRAGLLGLVYALLFGLACGLLGSGWGLGALVIGLVGLAVGFLLWFPIVSFQPVAKVLFPLALPDIVNSLRLLFGLAFGYIMLAEVINAEHGLGSIIIMSQRRGPREHIYLSLIIITALAFVIDRAILAAQRRLFPYRTTGEK